MYKGRIDATELSILQRLDIENDNWIELMRDFQKNTKGRFTVVWLCYAILRVTFTRKKRLCFQGKASVSLFPGLKPRFLSYS
ncbi:MAG TPA: hypothetical protein ENJ08_11370 [Gammaproteobacteria bacterium]|nr:hypothetical protein [Gammaproteobacteria bacterium]